MTEIKKEQLTPELFVKIYPLLEKGTERLIDGGSIASIAADLTNKAKDLWVVYENNNPICIAITQIIDYPHCRRLLYYLVSGEQIEKCFAHHDEIMRYAVYYGCSEVEMYGRRGWDRLLKRLGFKFNYISMTAKL